MDDGNEINEPCIGPASEEEHDRMVVMVDAVRGALEPHMREGHFGDDLAVAMASAQIFSGMLFGRAIALGLETATPERMHQMGQMLCVNFDYGIQRAIDNAAGGAAQGSA